MPAAQLMPLGPSRALDAVINATRPLRRRMHPRAFKEYYINRALRLKRTPTLYLEIGVRDGECFRRINADRRIGIDPVRTAAMRDLTIREAFFELTSDDFFTSKPQEAPGPASIDVALVDGWHEFGQALRDLLNLESLMRPDGVIFLDDFAPRTEERARDTPTGGAWNGDVWKVAPYLARARPDLTLFTVDADEGLGVVAGFNGLRVPVEQTILEETKALPYAILAERRAELLKLTPSRAFDDRLLRAIETPARTAP